MTTSTSKNITFQPDECYDSTFQQQQNHHEIGYARGRRTGALAGWHDGLKLGLKQGAKFASEIGYYQGFCQVWLSRIEHHTTTATYSNSNNNSDNNETRKLTALRTLLEMCINFPREVTQLKDNDDVKHNLIRIRNKYRQVCSLVNCGSNFMVAKDIRGHSWIQNNNGGEGESNFITTTSNSNFDF